MTDCKSIAKSLSEWLSTAQGNYVLEREKIYFDRTVNDIFGYNALQLGLPELDLLRNSRIPLRFTGSGQASADVQMCTDELPIATGSLDLVIMPHVLEFSDHPHAILREVERVLMPEGSVIISGFNPHSLWGIQRAFKRGRGYPWCGHFIALSRIKDWLSLLGFDVAAVRFSAYTPPFGQWLERLSESESEHWWAVSGGVYFLHAIKRVPGMRLLKPRWNDGLVKNLLPIAPKLNNTQGKICATHKAKPHVRMEK